ncbi:hypothetical protein BS47DRAFT_1350886 [Hydnum rufescens UP504]|uniref:Uncharacterized protein n=1 Tax=Hydnum rufescens UP504 TaxID=1448309 RepID=A0A9P6ALH4_9AGAM|nr:hypothetical protein BS47DRAFT_1350886 [Hydnum rufescens UP504]
MALGGDDSEDEDEDDDDEYGSEVTQPFFTLQMKPKTPTPTSASSLLPLVNPSCPAVGRLDSSTVIKVGVMKTKGTRK